ncbi:MAG TPA: hypothetical protein DCE23_00260 [Firmicutes bacterium]|nr:hypothetical protein [Bacillota bacterium]
MKDDDIIQEKEERVYKFGNSTVIVHIPQMTVAQKRKQLRKIYDTINEIARNCEKRGIDTSDWFYTDEEIKKMKNDPRYTFI